MNAFTVDSVPSLRRFMVPWLDVVPFDLPHKRVDVVPHRRHRDTIYPILYLTQSSRASSAVGSATPASDADGHANVVAPSTCRHFSASSPSDATSMSYTSETTRRNAGTTMSVNMPSGVPANCVT